MDGNFEKAQIIWVNSAVEKKQPIEKKIVINLPLKII